MAAAPTKPPGNCLKPPDHNHSIKEELFNERNCAREDITGGGKSKNNNNNLLHIEPVALSKKSTCNCSNIGIMHLFHEMKQEFPTIPDVIVTQCVSENCHQRENCIKMLRHELEMNPVPTQSYPAKILHPSNTNAVSNVSYMKKPSVQQKPQLQQKPLTNALKPIRPAPPKPTTEINQKNSSNLPNELCILPNPRSVDRNDAISKETISPMRETRDRRSIETAPTVTRNKVQSPLLPPVNNGSEKGGDKPQSIVKPRPTTLNLNTTSQYMQPQQQQHHQSLNVQLQQYFKQQHQRKTAKPLRKPPLPPLAANASTSSVQIQHSHLPNKEITSKLASPLPETAISVNVSLSNSSATSSPTAPTQDVQTNQSQKRHCSVITLQPDMPYTRDFLISSPTSRHQITPNWLGAGSDNSSPKSFTSVNLTLRQPTAAGACSPMVDIAAGPGLAGSIGTGFTYSSSSYDARQGCQKNFHITVTDDGSVISASRINQQQQLAVNDQNHNENVASLNKGKGDLTENVVENVKGDVKCNVSQKEENGNVAVVIKRQKEQRDKLASALCENEKRLQRLNRDIRLIKETIRNGLKERLILDIQKLCEYCESMVDEIENIRKFSTNKPYNRINYTLRQTQAFPQQIPTIPTSRLQTSNANYIQHQSATAPSRILQEGNDVQNQQHYYDQMQHFARHQQQQQQQQQQMYNSDMVGGGENDEIILDDEVEQDFWECNLCTFHNYPDLNICECCNVVRVLPGTLSNLNLSSVGNVDSATATFLSSNRGPLNGHLEHDTNLAQHFALHT